MMNRAFKPLVLAAVVSIMGVVPQVYAVEDQVARPAAAAFCERFTAASQASEAALAKRIEATKASRATADTKRTEQRASIDGTLNAQRQEANQKRETALANLLESAKSDAEKQAVQVYIDSVNGAITERRTANDQAQLVFRQSVDALLAQHRAVFDTQASTFVGAVRQAATQAQAECSRDGKASSKNMKVAVVKAKSNFTVDRAADVKLGEQIKALAATRNAAVKANNATAKAVIEQARAVLKTTLDE